MIKEVTNFKLLFDSDTPVLVDFWAPWCGPCRIQKPIIEKLSNEFENIKFVMFNVDDHPNIDSEYSIVGIPTIMLINNGKIIKTMSGLQNEENIKKLLKENL